MCVKALPTIKKVLKDGGSVVLMSHLGRPKNGPEDKYSLKHLVDHLSNLLGQEVGFAKDCVGAAALDMTSRMEPGKVILLENLRFYKHETAGDKNFAKQLATLGNVYINDAFGTAHRAHASTAIIAQFFPTEKMFGYLLEKEMEKALSLVQGGQPNLNASIIKNIKIKIPSLGEQQKIASVLTAADKEIELLEAKLAHFKQEKKALMQQLLTGKRRVKVDEEVAA